MHTVEKTNEYTATKEESLVKLRVLFWTSRGIWPERNQSAVDKSKMRTVPECPSSIAL